MKIIIAGVGKVGSTLARQLSASGYDITLIDVKQQVLESNVEKYDVMAVLGNCATMETLLQAGVNDADLLIAATGVKSSVQHDCSWNQSKHPYNCKDL